MRAAEPEPPAATEDPAAHFSLGLELADRGLHAQALREFEKAYQIQPRYQVLYNIGLVLRRIGHHQRSIEVFQRYLADGDAEITAERRSDVEAMMADSRTRLRLQDSPLPNEKSGSEVKTGSAIPSTAQATQDRAADLSSQSGSPALAAEPKGRVEASWLPRVLAWSAVAGSVAAVATYALNHRRFSRWQQEDEQLGSAVAPDEATRLQLVARQEDNDRLWHDIERVDRVAFVLGGAAVLTGVAAWLTGRRGPFEVAPVVGSRTIAATWTTRF